MSVADAWAEAVWVNRKVDLAFRFHPRIAFDCELEGSVRRLTKNLILCGGPTEFFSTEMPTWTPPPGEEGLRPIDILYGRYDAVDRSIYIFINRIQQDAPSFDATPSELTHIVRTHEYAHAIVHLGISVDYACDHLSTIGSNHMTDWPTLVARRTEWFGRTTSEVHELLAQAITYGNLATDPRAERLCRIYERLEAKQPPHYRLPVAVKSAAADADWPVVLDGAREVIDVERPEGFDMIAGLRAVLTRQDRVAVAEWVVSLPDSPATQELYSLLQEADSSDDVSRQREDRDDFSFLVVKFGGLKIEVFAREHGQPHFRVACAGETANYHIKDCEQINGGLRQCWRKIRKWHANNKQLLTDTWNATRPSDCPVGLYRES